MIGFAKVGLDWKNIIACSLFFSTLPLLVPWVVAQHIDSSMPADECAFCTALFHG